jgi:hypothetical protein
MKYVLFLLACCVIIGQMCLLNRMEAKCKEAIDSWEKQSTDYKDCLHKYKEMIDTNKALKIQVEFAKVQVESRDRTIKRLADDNIKLSRLLLGWDNGKGIQHPDHKP